MKFKVSVRAIFWILGIIFFIIGFCACVAGFGFLSSHRDFMDNAETTTAEITDIKSEYYYTKNNNRNNNNSKRNKRKVRYHVMIEYTVDGQLYERPLNEYNSDMYVGQEIEIYYNPDKPSEIGTGTDIGTIVCFSIGLPFLATGAVFIIINIVLAGKKKNLLKNGDVMSGTVMNVYENTSVRINGRHPYKADVQVVNPFDGETYLYSTKNISEDISHLMGQTVTVYVDKKNKRKYYVAIEEKLSQYITDNNIHDYR